MVRIWASIPSGSAVGEPGKRRAGKREETVVVGVAVALVDFELDSEDVVRERVVEERVAVAVAVAEDEMWVRLRVLLLLIVLKLAVFVRLAVLVAVAVLERLILLLLIVLLVLVTLLTSTPNLVVVFTVDDDFVVELLVRVLVRDFVLVFVFVFGRERVRVLLRVFVLVFFGARGTRLGPGPSFAGSEEGKNGAVSPITCARSSVSETGAVRAKGSNANANKSGRISIVALIFRSIGISTGREDRDLIEASSADGASKGCAA